jgi:hypothetical protein
MKDEIADLRFVTDSILWLLAQLSGNRVDFTSVTVMNFKVH